MFGVPGPLLEGTGEASRAVNAVRDDDLTSGDRLPLTSGVDEPGTGCGRDGDDALRWLVIAIRESRSKDLVVVVQHRYDGRHLQCS